MKDWRKALIGPHQTALEAMAAIDRGALQAALVVDADQRLAGIVTDGDIRAHILKGKSLDVTISAIMNAKPVTAKLADARDQLLSLMRLHAIHQLPIVDEARRVVDVVILDDLLTADVQPNLVVLMAGGIGSRLRPLTDDVPKPMLQIGERPILETIIEQFKEHGFRSFVVAMHYLGEQIAGYFGDGSKFGVQISYLREGQPMGTAGALSLLPVRPDKPFFVMNGDVLTKLNFSSLMAFHKTSASPLTMCVRQHAVTVPYGVAEIDGDQLVSLVEKPTYRHLVNAGIYACDPEIVDLIPRDRQTTMVDIAQKLVDSGRRPSVFPIHEYWVDIGLHGDYHRAGVEYSRVFG